MKKFLLILMFLSSCAKVVENPKLERRFLPAESLYFPKAVLSSDPRGDNLLNQWYSGMLLKLEEPALFKDTSDKEIYRFTLLRTSHHPVAVRMELDKGKVYVYSKETDGAGGYSPGDLIVNRKDEFPISIWENFVQRQRMFPFWKLPVNEGGFGGADWILEMKNAKEYHVMRSLSPDPGEVFYQYCIELLNLSKLKVTEIY